MKLFLITSMLCLSLSAYCIDVLSECKRLYETHTTSCIFANKKSAKRIYNRNKIIVKEAISYDKLPDDIFGYATPQESLKESFKTWVKLKNIANKIINENLPNPFSYLYNQNLTTKQKTNLLILLGRINDKFNDNEKKQFKDWLNDLKNNTNNIFNIQQNIKLYYSKWGIDDNPLNYIKSLEYDLFYKENITENDLKGITEIHEDSFNNDDTLQSIAIPNSVKSIDIHTFCFYSGLTISFPQNWQAYKDKKEFQGCLYLIINKNTLFPLLLNEKTIFLNNENIITTKRSFIKYDKSIPNITKVTLFLNNLQNNPYTIKRITGSLKGIDQYISDEKKWDLIINTHSTSFITYDEKCFKDISNFNKCYMLKKMKGKLKEIPKTETLEIWENTLKEIMKIQEDEINHINKSYPKGEKENALKIKIQEMVQIADAIKSIADKKPNIKHIEQILSNSNIISKLNKVQKKRIDTGINVSNITKLQKLEQEISEKLQGYEEKTSSEQETIIKCIESKKTEITSIWLEELS